jgi:AbrB family looped-hinge helix DNA binding protein
MKATGIVRRIDDLGRVVIPKEVRRSMNIREGDPLEIFTDENGIIGFKKYTVEGTCIFCGSATELELLERPVCEKCQKKLKTAKSEKIIDTF